MIRLNTGHVFSTRDRSEGSFAYETSEFDPEQYVPDGFELDEVIDFDKKVNYIYRERGGENVWRVSVHKDAVLYTVWLYANNKGHSRSIQCRSEADVQEAYRVLVDHLDQSASKRVFLLLAASE